VETLYLVRHAQSRPKASQHHSRWELSARGFEQAKQLAHLLQPLRIRKIFSSPYTRCLQTVTPFAAAGDVQVTVVDGLRERLVARGFVENFGEIWEKSWEDFDYAPPGCESSSEAQNRFVDAVANIADSAGPGPSAISTHGNVIGLFLNWIDRKAGLQECEMLMNPDVIRIVKRDREFIWDRDFRLQGLADIATDFRETPFEKSG
jgi:2,3-bisphosphoglycerate-dependent phosphoglycerate mutase